MTTFIDDQLVVRQKTTPGWPELVAGAAAFAASYALVAVALPLIEDDATAGVVGLVVSGLMGMIALAAAVVIRIRGLSAFGIRRAKKRHLIVGAALGIVVCAVGSIGSGLYIVMSGDAQNIQTTYQAGAAGGLMSLLVTFVAGSIITPIGEEAFFRGVVANTLLARLGPWVGIIGSAAVFAVAHGINPVMVAAFLVGIVTAILFRWSGSIWPGVVLHGVNNTAALILPVIIAAAIN
ncbi:CPBP family intramembrane metalloprotease [Cryobacterium lactosi]|uniref:CPBP family intramembrane metalloprotease n=1 Tax=Cryobacterium lactosi TaxID=1259202 RepID=A0A4R9BYG2_9MICO|nr:CPBP family intramembrane glutamic endopeptidase [Cryobacterium lactosi]TFD92082.1 CPBP family intramembrane metalloprotease [Cryobacterium lactosi]